jgi:hypothetical protein
MTACGPAMSHQSESQRKTQIRAVSVYERSVVSERLNQNRRPKRECFGRPLTYNQLLRTGTYLPPRTSVAERAARWGTVSACPRAEGEGRGRRR